MVRSIVLTPQFSGIDELEIQGTDKINPLEVSATALPVTPNIYATMGKPELKIKLDGSREV